MNSAHDASTIRKPVIHHIHELQRRLTWSLLAVGIGAGIAYSVSNRLLAAVQKPLGETLYYTSPMGGFNFLLKLCLAFGFILGLPVILYNIFAFLGPLLQKRHKLLITIYTVWSFILACAGVLFAYYISLPSALHFLSKFGGASIHSLITVDEYFNFALAYLAGFALIFQVPLLVLFINRVTPLKPSKMMRAQRYIILFSFIAAAMLTPTPDPLNQTIMALPAILLYQVGVILVWLVNRNKRPAKPAIIDVEPIVPKPQPTMQPVMAAQTYTPRAWVPANQTARTVTSTQPVQPRIATRPITRQSIDGIMPRAETTT